MPNLLLICLLAPELWFSAARLEASADRWRGDAVELRLDGIEVSARQAEGVRTAACPTAALTLVGPLSARSTDWTLSAGSGHACLPDGQLEMQAIEVRSPTVRLGAARATISGQGVSADDLWATRCACDDPPWRVTASHVSGTLNRGLWATWPVLWAGPIPVATAPVWYVPLGERRSGLLAPRLGWDGELGGWGYLPAYWAPHRSFDLTLAPGYRHGLGAAAQSQARWATSPLDRGRLDIDYVLGEGVTAGGDGSVSWGPARLALSGDLTTDRAVRQAIRANIDARRADYQRAATSLSAAGERFGVGVRGAWLQSLRADSLTDNIRTPLPESWMMWTQDVGPALTRLSAQHTHLVRGTTADVVDLGLDSTVVQWIGPLRLHPEFGVATTLVADDAGSDQAVVGYAIAAATVGVGRSFGALRHTLLLTARGLWSASDQPIAARRTDLGPRLRPLDRRGAEATVSNRLIAATWSGRVDVTGGVEADGAPLEGRLPISVDTQVDSRFVGLSATASEADFLAADLRLGDPSEYDLGLEYNRAELDAQSAMLRTRGRPMRLLADTPDGATGGARASVALGRVRVSYRIVGDLDASQLVGQQGALAYTGRCDCWTLRIDGTHQAGRDSPDVWLSLSL